MLSRLTKCTLRLPTQIRHFSTPIHASSVSLGREFSTPTTLEHVIVEHKDGGVGLVTLNRPKALNALCYPLFKDLYTALEQLDNNPEISAIVLTGSLKAFAAGADIKEMKD